MSQFEDDLIQRIQAKILSDVSKHNWLDLPAYNDRFILGKDLLARAYEQIDKDAIIALLADKLNHRIADKIADSMQTEVANDVKQLMSNGVVRGQIREALSAKMMEIIKQIQEKD